MKIRSISISTNYPRGYGSDDPRLITGTCSVRTSASTWSDEDHALTPDALKQIADICLADFQANRAPIKVGDMLFDAAELPPVEQAPAESDTPDSEPAAE